MDYKSIFSKVLTYFGEKSSEISNSILNKISEKLGIDIILFQSKLLTIIILLILLLLSLKITKKTIKFVLIILIAIFIISTFLSIF